MIRVNLKPETFGNTKENRQIPFDNEQFNPKKWSFIDSIIHFEVSLLISDLRIILLYY